MARQSGLDSAGPIAIDDVPFNDLQRFASSNARRLAKVARRVVESGWYVLGPETEAFEEEFGTLCGVQFCIGVGNGTDALEIALRSVGCGPGDEVITCANAGMYTTSACLAIGATPVFADVDRDTLLVAPTSVASLVTGRTRAVVVTHLYGNIVDVTELRRSVPASVAIVEDGSQAHGGALRGRPVGSLGDAAAFSFYPTKNLGALGDAGAIVSNDEEVHRRAKALRQYGWESRYVAKVPGGRNSRIDELQAAILRELMPGLHARNELRRSIRADYVNALSRRLHFVDMTASGAYVVPHLCVVRSAERSRLISDLRSVGIGSAIHYPVADHEQDAMSDVAFRHDGLQETELACREVMSLPSFPEIRDDEVQRVIAAIERFT
jgi:dTDP-4-amino-4,6-dideoxygalactose transaminase